MLLRDIISLVLGNFGLAMLILAVIIAGLSQLLQKTKTPAAEIWFRWMVLLPYGLTGLYAFVMHAFWGEFTASTIGWANSPFQYEVAMANLGFGLIGTLAFRASYGFRLAVVISCFCWLEGDAVGHIMQMITMNNFAPGNAGSWFWMDIFMPFILAGLLYKLKKPRVNSGF